MLYGFQYCMPKLVKSIPESFDADKMRYKAMFVLLLATNSKSCARGPKMNFPFQLCINVNSLACHINQENNKGKCTVHPHPKKGKYSLDGNALV